MKQLPSGLVVPSDPPPPPKPQPGFIQDPETRKAITEGLMKIVRSMHLGERRGIGLPGDTDRIISEAVENSVKSIGVLCLGSFSWEVKT